MVHAALRVGTAMVVCGVFSLPAHAQIGNSMVTFLQEKVGTRLGGGECAHMATEALRVSGGEFFPPDLGADYPASGDYVWGTLVTVISYANKKWSDSNPTNQVQPGDIMQFGGSAKIGTTAFPTRHTAVVSAVNTTTYRPTSMYQQNFAKVRTVTSATIDTTKLIAGWIRIYRPIPRLDATNQWKVTVVNNATTSQTYNIMVGTSSVSSVSLTAANTAGSFKIQKLTTTGTVPCLVLSNNQSIYLTNARGEEIYGSPAAVRELSQ